jgi:hypothetical protein
MRELRQKHGLSHPIPVFGITAGKYCPSAKDCKVEFKDTGSKCFGLSGAYLFPVVANAYDWRGEMTKSSDFVDMMYKELSRKKSKYVRIHDIGDFYSDRYLHMWLNIMRMAPDKIFWCYTKEVARFKAFEELDLMPPNFRYVYSYGGKNDDLINPDRDRHSMTVEPDKGAYLMAYGYTDLTADEFKITDNKLRKFYTVAH